jgi:hypothetical protein
LEQTKQGASDAAGTTQDKANEASNVAGEKWEQTKQASSHAAQAASDKAGQAKEGAGGLLQQVGGAANSAYEKVKATVTPSQ